MNTLQLEYFVTVVNEGGILRAAEKLMVSPSAVSQTIKKLEEEMDVKLFDRVKQNLVLNYAGRRFFKYARTVLIEKNNFIQEIHDYHGNIYGELTVFLSEYKAAVFLPILVPPFLKKYPKVHLNLVDRHLTPELRRKNMIEGIYDFTISPHSINDDHIQHIPICRERLCVIIGKNTPLARRLFPDGKPPASISLSHFKDESFILTRRGNSSRDCADMIFQSMNVQPDILTELSSATAAYELASTELACTILHRYTGRRRVLSPCSPVYEIPIDHPAASRDIYLIYNKTTYMSAIHYAFIQTVLEVLDEYPELLSQYVPEVFT